MASFGSRLSTAFDRFGQLCVGIDPHPWLLKQWDLPDTSEGAREFALRTVDAATGQVGIVKPQVAFFERFGSAGFAVLEEVLRSASAAGLLTIADAKRGDVGTSVEAYCQAWLTTGSPLEADAMTVSAFQGVESLKSALEHAQEHEKGMFVLAATSNPEAALLQQAETATGHSVANSIVQDVVRLNDAEPADSVGSIGVVLGATVRLEDYGIERVSLRDTPILAPGFGHQGARIGDIVALYGPAASSVLVSVSRSILSAGRNGIADAIATQAGEVLACRV